MNREQWLTSATKKLRPMFKQHGAAIPENVRVSCSWPSGSVRKVIGEAWTEKACADGAHETYISPVLDKPVDVLAVLVHELVHHAFGIEAGHKAPFKRLATTLGLTGKMTETTAGPELTEKLTEIAEKLGPYPHGKVTPGQGKTKQGTRLIKCKCSECGYIVRTTSKWLDSYGPPLCPCNSWAMDIELG